MRASHRTHSVVLPADGGIRRDPLIAQVLDQAPDVIGFQEVRAHQLKDLVRGLKGEYDYVAQETGGKNDVVSRRERSDGQCRRSG